MAGFFDSIAEGARDVGGKLAQGIGDTIMQTQAGPLLDPFFESTREKKAAPIEQERAEQIEFNRGQRERKLREQSIYDEQRQIKFIDMNKTQAEKNIMSELETMPSYTTENGIKVNSPYASMTDIDKNKAMQAPEMKELVNLMTVSRLGVTAAEDPKQMDTFKKALSLQGIELTQEDGKYYMNHPEDGKIEVNEENMINGLNGFKEQAFKAVQAQALYTQQKQNVIGMASNARVDAIMQNARDGAGEKSLSSAFNDEKAFMKANNFTSQQLHVNWLNTGLQKVFKDNKVTGMERQEVLLQLQTLGEKIGIVSRPTADPSDIAELQAPNGTWMPLRQYAEELAKPGQDIVSDRFNALMNGDQDGNQTLLDQEFSEEIAGDLPEENVEVVKAAIAPLMEDTSIDSEERKGFASAISDMIDFSSVESDPDKLLRQVEALADEKDLSEDKIYELLPPEIKKPVGLQIAKEAEAKAEKELKRALKQQERNKKRASAFKKGQKDIIEARKGLPSGFGF